MKQESKVGYRDIFRQTEYMKIMIAALINRFGDSIDAIASTWIVYESQEMPHGRLSFMV